MKQFKTLIDLLDYFRTERDCANYFAKERWKERILCPHCDGFKIYVLGGHDRYRCGFCKRDFNCRTGTFMDGTKLPMRKWFATVYLLTIHKKGISSHQLAKDVGVTQKTAWFMLHRIRKALSKQSVSNLEGVVQCDETYVGGKNKNRHADKKVKNGQGRSYIDKTPVLGIMQTGGQLDAEVVPDVTGRTIMPIVRQKVIHGSKLVTDEWSAYNEAYRTYEHYVVEHAKKQYVAGGLTTNSIEGFWSHLKRGIIGIYHNVSREHLNYYVKEFVFRYNHRNFTSFEMFNKFISISEHRLKYKDLISVWKTRVTTRSLAN